MERLYFLDTQYKFICWILVQKSLSIKNYQVPKMRLIRDVPPYRHNVFYHCINRKTLEIQKNMREPDCDALLKRTIFRYVLCHFLNSKIDEKHGYKRPRLLSDRQFFFYFRPYIISTLQNHTNFITLARTTYQYSPYAQTQVDTQSRTKNVKHNRT